MPRKKADKPSLPALRSNTGKTTRPDQLLTAQRELAVFEARKRGYSYREIAASLGNEITPQACHQIVVRTLKKLRAKTAEAADDVRTMELLRLDAMLQGLWGKATNGDCNAVLRAIQLGERRAAILGTDAPKKTAVTDTDGKDVPLTGGGLAGLLGHIANGG